MFEYDLDTEHSILHVQPKSAILQDDFTKLAKAVDPHIEATGGLAGLIVEAPGFPGWESLGAMVNHFRFVRDHHRRNLTIDSCTDTGNPGVLTVITEGPVARQIGKLTDDERKKAVLDAVAERFGGKALSPVDYLEQNWAVERYSGGAMISHTPPGVLTEFGPALREPCGRIHWAGTETSAKMYGFIGGAVRSGERAAAEVMEREAMTVA
jgi:monoamine oxidase